MGPGEERFTKAEAKDTCAKVPEANVNKGEYRRSDGQIARKGSHIFIEEPSERVEIADTAEASQIQVTNTIEAADEPFEESQLM